MTKEEYLKAYKEDKLAEICEHLEKYRDDLLEQMTELGKRIRELNKKCEDLDIWEDTEKVFAKLKSIPAEDFIKLYYRMQDTMNNHGRYENTFIPKPSNWSDVITTISSR